MYKMFIGIFLVLFVMLGISFAKGLSAGSVIVQKVEPSAKTVEEWEHQRREVLGEFVAVLEVQTPQVGFTYPDDKGLIVNFLSTESTVSSVLTCDGRTGTYQYSYHHSLINDEAALVTDFAIVYYKPGIDMVYENDLKNSQLFSSSRNDSNLAEVLKDITNLPEDGIVSFVVEQTDNDYITKIVGYGPTMTVKDFKQIYDKINFQSCSSVELISDPVSL